MDWPVIGSVTGVVALGASVAGAGWLVLDSKPMATNGAPAPVLLVDTRPAQHPAAYQVSLQRPAVEEPHFAPAPLAKLTALPLSEPEKPLRLAKPPSHTPPHPPRKSVVAKPQAETLPAHAQTPPAIVDERYAHVLTPDKVGQLRRMLHLRADQQQHWPPVEAMLHQIGRIQMAHIRRGESPEVDSGLMMQLYSASQPLLSSLLPAQKEKIRSLARSLGYPNVASML